MRRCLFLAQCTESQWNSSFGVTWSPTCAVSKNNHKRQHKTADCFRLRFRLFEMRERDSSAVKKIVVIFFITRSVYSAAVDLSACHWLYVLVYFWFNGFLDPLQAVYCFAAHARSYLVVLLCCVNFTASFAQSAGNHSADWWCMWVCITWSLQCCSCWIACIPARSASVRYQCSS